MKKTFTHLDLATDKTRRDRRREKITICLRRRRRTRTRRSRRRRRRRRRRRWRQRRRNRVRRQTGWRRRRCRSRVDGGGGGGDEAAGVWFGLLLKQTGLRFEWENINWRIPISYTDWGDSNLNVDMNLPDDTERSKKIQCASLSKQYDWAWESKPCGESTDMKYVCKRCAPEQVCTSRTCFRLLCERSLHFSADGVCNDLGGSLATIRSQEESNAVKNFLEQVSFSHDGWGKGGADVWLAGSDEYSEGNWYWDTNRQKETISADDFTDWNTNEPNNAGNGENCMTMSVGDWKWNDINCRSIKFVLCEIPGTSIS
ncbi:mannose-binding protein c [Plakobranchus ocellatus]|uniref:Mannose-binding protein c n=1 Tax=Plakobranchus ocellatus TaxID=259542 RepID=A0AAV4BYD0_9GAST|nr:mannose-binding protein c [Plakobranchus ocellatus]